MEGYLYKKGRGDSSFGRRSWKKRWFVLDGQDLIYYDELDPSTGQPKNLRGTENVKGYECFPVTHHDKHNTFVLKPPKGTDLFLQAPDQKLMNRKTLIGVTFFLS